MCKEWKVIFCHAYQNDFLLWFCIFFFILYDTTAEKSCG